MFVGKAYCFYENISQDLAFCSLRLNEMLNLERKHLSLEKHIFSILLYYLIA